MNDDMVQAAIGDLDAADEHRTLPPSTVAALRLADVLTSDHPIVTDEFQAELRVHYSDEQILEIGTALSIASGWQTFIEAFGIRPDSWTPGSASPERPGN
jgi:alkylhydroperoxidase family enzyme